MKQMIISLTFLLTFCTGFAYSSSSCYFKEETTSRFIRKDDCKVESLVGMDLPSSWWSRPYEYAWASKFSGKNYTVLDAACGISHPFKWHLYQTNKETWACDTDSRIENILAIMINTQQDLGEKARQILVLTPEFYQSTHLVKASIDNLSDDMPNFDRIFCISTLEHMPKIARKKTLIEFSRKLTPDGLIILTVDYPLVNPETLLADARSAGLVPAGEVELDLPSQDAIFFAADGMTSHIPLHVYRCVLMHAK